MLSLRATLSDLIDDLEAQRDQFGDCPVIGISEKIGEHSGVVNPYVFYLLQGESTKMLCVRSGAGGRPKRRHKVQKNETRNNAEQLQLFG